MPGGAPDTLNGFVWWFVVGFYGLTVALSAFVAGDSVRPPRRPRLDAIREPWWLYLAVAVVYLVSVVAAWVPLPASLRWLHAIPVGLTVVAFGFGVAYLLRVVFPAPAKGAEPEAIAEPDAPPSDAAEQPEPAPSDEPIS